MSELVVIRISKHTNKVVFIENNHSTENYNKCKVDIGDKIGRSLRALMLMNPHRFKITYV